MNKWKPLLGFLMVFSAVLIGESKVFAQADIYLKGTVLDASTNKPIELANISVKNSAKGSITDKDGFFKVKIKPGDSNVLIISHINYSKEELVVKNNSCGKLITVFLQQKSIKLSDVIVSAGLYNQPLNRLTHSASKIDHREILDNVNSNMIDMLATIPGITQVWEYHSPIILRGLNSNRVLIMKDGNRRIGTFPGGYFAQDMNIYDTRKVEVIKGPASVIYGSGAISGIVNVISNKPIGKNHQSVQLHSGYGSNNNESMELARVCLKDEKFGISVNGKYRKTDNLIYGNGSEALNSDVEDRDFALKTGLKLADKQEIIVNANYHYGDWGKPRGFNGPKKDFTKIRNEEESIHAALSYSYSPKKFVESINMNVYYDKGWRDYFQYKYSTVNEDLTSLDLVHYKDNYGGGRFYTVLNLSSGNKLTTGVDCYLFRLDNPSENIDYYNNTQGTMEGYKNAGQQNIGVFINDDWNVSKNIRFVAGVRYDNAKVVEGESISGKGRNEHRNAVSGNVGFVYSPGEDTHISLNAGRAFRMPTAEELFTKVISCKGVKMGNPDLDAEYSWNFDLGFRGNAECNKFRYDISLFYNLLDDFINESPEVSNEDIDFTYENTDAELMGGELSTSYRFDGILAPSNMLYVGLGAAYVYGIDKSDDKDKPLFGMPPFNAQLELDYRGRLNKAWITGYSIKLATEYAAEQNRIAEIPEGTDGGPWGYITSDSHTVFNLTLGANFNSLTGSPKLRVVGRNIFDTDYQPFGSYIPAMGRNIKILLSLHF